MLSDTATSTATLVHAQGTDARGTYAAAGTSTATVATAGGGNSRAGVGSSTASQSGSSTVTTEGGDGTTGYTRTVTTTGGSGTTAGWSATTGLATSTGTATSTATTGESGSNPTTSYTLAATQTATTTEAGQSGLLTGAYTLSRSTTTGSSLHAEGAEGTAREYTLDKTETGYDTSVRQGNAFVGVYTLGGTFGSTSTAVETMAHGAYGATFTEVLTEDGTASETGYGGDYARHEWGDRSADFVQTGTSASGSYHVTEGSTGSFDRTEIGNSATGGYSLSEVTALDYSLTQTVAGSETWTLTGSGSDAGTAVEHGDRVTGGYTRAEVGTDGYTLTQTGTLSGGPVSQTVTGTDTYAISEAGNRAKQTYARETTGGGGWVRTGTNAGSGTNGYTLALAGDERAGHFSASATGTDRYALVERFDDISNTDAGVTTPGNVSFHSHGLPFRDPTPEELWTRRNQLEKDLAAYLDFKRRYPPTNPNSMDAGQRREAAIRAELADVTAQLQASVNAQVPPPGQSIFSQSSALGSSRGNTALNGGGLSNDWQRRAELAAGGLEMRSAPSLGSWLGGGGVAGPVVVAPRQTGGTKKADSSPSVIERGLTFAWESIAGVVFGYAEGNGSMASEPERPSPTFQTARVIGNALALAQGITEIDAGLTAVGGGGLVTATGAGAPIGIPVAVVGAAVGVHGAFVAGNSTLKLAENIAKLDSDTGGGSGSSSAGAAPEAPNFSELPDSVRYRYTGVDKKGRRYGTPGNDKVPTLEQLNPRIQNRRAGNLTPTDPKRLHPENPQQAERVSKMSNDELVRFDPNDPISATQAPDGSQTLSGGHHRTAEIIRRVKDGMLPADTNIPVLIHD